MINFEKKDGVGIIKFSDADVDTIIKVFHRALNTWSPSPPQDLLKVQADIMKSWK